MQQSNYEQSTQYGYILHYNDYPVDWSIPLIGRNGWIDLKFVIDVGIVYSTLSHLVTPFINLSAFISAAVILHFCFCVSIQDSRAIVSV